MHWMGSAMRMIACVAGGRGGGARGQAAFTPTSGACTGYVGNKQTPCTHLGLDHQLLQPRVASHVEVQFARVVVPAATTQRRARREVSSRPATRVHGVWHASKAAMATTLSTAGASPRPQQSQHTHSNDEMYRWMACSFRFMLMVAGRVGMTGMMGCVSRNDTPRTTPWQQLIPTWRRLTLTAAVSERRAVRQQPRFKRTPGMRLTRFRVVSPFMATSAASSSCLVSGAFTFENLGLLSRPPSLDAAAG